MRFILDRASRSMFSPYFVDDTSAPDNSSVILKEFEEEQKEILKEFAEYDIHFEKFFGFIRADNKPVYSYKPVIVIDSLEQLLKLVQKYGDIIIQRDYEQPKESDNRDNRINYMLKIYGDNDYWD